VSFFHLSDLGDCVHLSVSLWHVSKVLCHPTHLCIGVQDALQKVEGVFQCESCSGDVDEDCVIDGLVRVESFVFLSNKLNAGGSCLDAECVWVGGSFRELSAMLCR
jgi:hypothetical protein